MEFVADLWHLPCIIEKTMKNIPKRKSDSGGKISQTKRRATYAKTDRQVFLL